MKNFLKKYGHAWVLSYGVIYLTWFFHLEKTVTSGYHIMHMRIDDYIPFVEYFIIPYFLWFLYVAVSIGYFFFTSKEDYYRLCAFLFTGMTISLFICTIFPNGTDLRPVVDPDKNFCTYLVSLLHKADTNTNVFPSIHAFNSMGVHFAVINSERLRNKKGLRFFSFALMIAICLSTMFLKQHSAIDVIGAVIMAYIIYPFVYSHSFAANRRTVRQRQNVTG